MRVILEFLKDESGATAVEYGLIATLVAVGIVAGARAIGVGLNDGFQNTANIINNAETNF